MAEHPSDTAAPVSTPSPAAFMPLQSSNVLGCYYDDTTQDLMVLFKSGRSYTYSGVPGDVYEGLLKSSSPGAYVHEVLSGYE
jgi:hypothetical protein